MRRSGVPACFRQTARQPVRGMASFFKDCGCASLLSHVQRVTYTGGRNPEGGTPAPGAAHQAGRCGRVQEAQERVGGRGGARAVGPWRAT